MGQIRNKVQIINLNSLSTDSVPPTLSDTVLFYFIFFREEKRESVIGRGGERERNLKEAPHSAWSSMGGSIPRP